MPTSRKVAAALAAMAALAARPKSTTVPRRFLRQSAYGLARSFGGARDPELRRRRRGADPRRGPAARAEPRRDEPPGLRAARRRAADPRPPRRLFAAGDLLRPRRDRGALPGDGGADRRGRARGRAPRPQPPFAAPPRRERRTRGPRARPGRARARRRPAGGYRTPSWEPSERTFDLLAE